MINEITQGDCLEVMKRIPDGSVDMILADLPYGTTSCKWDTIIPLEPLWEQYERVIKDGGAIVLTASQPFTSALIMSKPDLFKYEWIWEKQNAGSFMAAKRMPLKVHENILVFNASNTYKPQKEKVLEYEDIIGKNKKELAEIMRSNRPRYYGVIDRRKTINNPRSNKSLLGLDIERIRKKDDGYRFPKSVFKINRESINQHPTQKPVALFEYLIKTYTNEGELVLDNCIGSGTTAVAAINTGRNFIGIEQEPEYVEIARRRIDEAYKTKEGR